MIVETEAYLGVRDRACHSYGGRRTPRVEVMYKKGGHSYVYFIYGMYHCLNVVTRGENRPEAVLIRALYDPNDVDPRRYAGPGKLCKALRITKTHNAIDFVSNRLLTIKKDGSAVRNLPMVCTKRVGVESYGKAADAKLRYYLKGHPAVSRR
jgi:DNA-3-methyladenine glycosylase